MSSSSKFRATFYASMKGYERKAKNDLLTHPLMTQLQACNSPTDILAILRARVQQVERGDDNLTKWLGPTVHVLYAFSGELGADVGLEFSPANVIFAGAGVLLSAAEDVIASQDEFIDILDRLEYFFRRLEGYTTVPTTEAMKDVIRKIMVEALGIFAIVTKEIKQGRAKMYLKKLIGRRDIEDAPRRLDILTLEEARMAAAQVLKLRVEREETVGYRVHDIQDSVKAVDESVKDLVRDYRYEDKRIGVRAEHRKWLCPPDPSTNQNIACGVQRAGTAAWFLQGGIFMKWRYESTTTLLWIHGKLGSGKSVLCSAIIEDLMPLRDAGQVSMAYFYFDFRDSDKKNLHNLLPSLLTQLSARSDKFCDILSHIYMTHDHGARKPSTITLIACLKEMLTLPDQGPVYIILDALDECPNTSGIPSAREQLLAFLKDLVGLQLSDLHLCVTSRPEIDIRVALEPLIPHSISLHDQSGQREDIEDYIRSVVYDSEKTMRRWRDEDKDLVIQTLTERADGMFRWVFCQLEALGHCLSYNLRQTLHELPESLDQTYERVLLEIGLGDRDQAHRLLQCLTVAIRPLRVEDLAEILAFDFDGAEGATPKLSDWRREDRQQSVLSMCSGLVTLVADGDSRVIQFSHFSVKEFLSSNRLAASKRDTSHFHIKPEDAHTTFAQACLGILLQLDGTLNSSHVEDIFPLVKYASQHWVGHAQFGLVSSRIQDGMRRLFDSTKPHFSAWLQLHDIDEPWDNFGTYETTEPGSPLYYASLCGFHDLVAHIIATHPEQVNVRGGRNYSPLAAALHKRHFDVAELLCQHGAGVDVTGFTNQTPLQAASVQGHIDVARWLLDHGADDQDNLSTPIISGATNEDLEVGERLLPSSVRIDATTYASYTPFNASIENLTEEAGGLLIWHDYPSDNPSREIASSPLTPRYSHSQSSTPPSRATHPSPPPIAARELRSFDERELSLVSDATAHAITSTMRVTPQATSRVSVQLPADSLDAAATPATISPAHSPFVSLTSALSLSPAIFPGRVGSHQSDGDGALTPPSTRWGNLKGKRAIPIEQAEGYSHTRSRVIGAIGGALGMAASIGHEALFTGVDLLQFVPVPGLNTAGNILLNIWDAIEMVETNRQACLRLTERCADILISIRGEIADVGCTVAEELRAPIAKLVEAFEELHHFLDKLGKRSFLKRYLRRNETLSGISACDTTLKDALEMFDRSILLRTLKLIQLNELQRHKETHDLLKSLSQVSPGLPPAHLPFPPAALQSSAADPESLRNTLRALRASQNVQDRARDMADLHQLLRAALARKDDDAMIEVLQIARSEMPEAIKTLERALERLAEDGQQVTEENTIAPLPSQHKDAGNGSGPFVNPGDSTAGEGSADPLDREFIETGIGALRRLSKGADLGLPSWTITRFEIDLEERVGVGFFSDVYRGTWREHTVAVQVLTETTPRKIFLREVGIWKSLYHPNVLELFGASSASGEPPWFLVSKYYPRGNLVKYLKGLSDTDAARVDALKMIHEISKGMAYLHKQGVLHGDLKAANILVDDDTDCVISDFGQSEMKSEVNRITRASQPCGTLRWQAPELMRGAQALTQEMDVYAFGICCGEILTMGALPWPFMDDHAVRHSVLNENMRPSLPPPSNLVNDQLVSVIRASWDSFPSNRPSFEQISLELKKQRAGRNAHSINSQTPLDWE